MFVVLALAASAPPLFAAEVNGSARQFTYVALGDSITAGSGAREGFVPKLDRMLEQDARVAVDTVNLGVPGWRSSDLLRALRTDKRMRESVESAQVVTIGIGGNDLLAAYGATSRGNPKEIMLDAIERCKDNWDQILAEVKILRRGNMLGVRTMDIYNPLVGLLVQLKTLEVLKPYLDDLNADMRRTAEQYGATPVHVYERFNGPDGRRDAVREGLISQDGIHPSEKGYDAIAELMHDAESQRVSRGLLQKISARR